VFNIETIKTGIKRVWKIADIHLGIRNSSAEWIEIHREYFFNYFIPLLRKNMEEGDALFILGDVNDNRQGINIRVLTLLMEIMEELSKTLPVYIIIGNHDMWQSRSTDINSLDHIKWVKHKYEIKVFTEPVIIETVGASYLMLPWNNDHNDEKKWVEHFKGKVDNICAHTDFKGLMFNRHTMIQDGLDTSLTNGYEGVYSGHIHFAQDTGNVHMLGSICEFTRSDMGNTKRALLYDCTTREKRWFYNHYSPRFKKIMLVDLLSMTQSEADKFVNNNFVDVGISSNRAFKSNMLNKLTQALHGYRRLEYKPMQEDSMEDKMHDHSVAAYSIDELINEAIEGQKVSNEKKQRMRTTLMAIKNECLESMKFNTEE